MPRGNLPKRTYLHLIYGKVREKTDNNNPDAVPREIHLDDGTTKTVYEIINDFIEGRITEITYKEEETFNDRWQIKLNDGTEEFIIGLTVGTVMCYDFLQKLPNIDFNLPVRFIPHYFEASKTSRLTMQQEGEKVKSWFTKEESHGIPSIPEKDASGKRDKDEMKIAMSQRNKFLKEMVKDKIYPLIEKANKESENDLLENVQIPDPETEILVEEHTETFEDVTAEQNPRVTHPERNGKQSGKNSSQANGTENESPIPDDDLPF